MKENLNSTEFKDAAMCTNESKTSHPMWYNLKYLLVGIIFGIAFVKAEIISWFRIQEMFRFESFHMYGVIGTGVVLGMISIQIIKRFNIKTRPHIWFRLGNNRSMSWSLVRTNGCRL